MNVVEVKKLSKSFLNVKVLDEINFEIHEGRFLALLGKNGSGKSTILNILIGNEKLDQGEVYIFGKDIKKDPSEIKNLIGYVSEKIQFSYPMTIHKFLQNYGRFFDFFDFDFIEKAANDLGISLNKQFDGYSRGQKMQIILLAALAHRPKLLLIDEITSVLDASSRKYFISLLKDFTLRGGTVLITTNIVNEVQYFCDEVIFIENSRIKFQTALKDIPSNFIKIRVKDADHPILNVQGVVWVGINSDGTQSYIAPDDSLGLFPDVIRDLRAVTLEDLYIYHSQQGEK